MLIVIRNGLKLQVKMVEIEIIKVQVVIIRGLLIIKRQIIIVNSSSMYNKFMRVVI